MENNEVTMMMINGKEVKIDNNCVELILFLNRNGLKTKFCCEGHYDTPRETYQIIFDESVTDEDIINFQNKYYMVDTINNGSFYKWSRWNYCSANTYEDECIKNEIRFNWIFQINKGYELNHIIAKDLIKELKIEEKKILEVKKYFTKIDISVKL